MWGNWENWKHWNSLAKCSAERLKVHFKNGFNQQNNSVTVKIKTAAQCQRSEKDRKGPISYSNYGSLSSPITVQGREKTQKM